MESNRKSVFETLSAINCNEYTEKKNGLTYLSWAFAWKMVKKNFPSATYTIYESENGTPYFTDGKTCWVKTGVTIEELEHIEYLPIMDFRNNSIPLESVTSMDMNKAIQRSLTKACARHGLGLYIYAGEDLPEEAEEIRYTPLPEDKYLNLVGGYAKGKTTKTGGDLRSAWIEATHATPEAIAKFDADIAQYRKTYVEAKVSKAKKETNEITK